MTEHMPATPQSGNTEPTHKRPAMRRRDFLSGLAATLGAVVLGGAGEANRDSSQTARLAAEGSSVLEKFAPPILPGYSAYQVDGSFARWEDAKARIADAEPMQRGANASYNEFLDSLDALQKDAPETQLACVNTYVNNLIIYTPDDRGDALPQGLTKRGGKDYWSHTFQTLLTKKGDCEDYAIAKYTALMYLGWKESDLSLLLVGAKTNQSHMVLLVSLGGTLFCLDNRVDRIMDFTEHQYTFKDTPQSIFTKQYIFTLVKKQ